MQVDARKMGEVVVVVGGRDEMPLTLRISL